MVIHMTHAIGKMANEIYKTTKRDCSVYLYGSVTLDDFRKGRLGRICLENAEDFQNVRF